MRRGSAGPIPARQLRQSDTCGSPTSALAINVGDVKGEVEASLARTQDEGAPGRSSRTRTKPGASLAVLNAANVCGRGTSDRPRGQSDE
jgi:hypothetical protein